VAAARLTCGQPRRPPTFPQVKAKCEDLTQVKIVIRTANR
jgi:hypothetical protein